eukprot:366556-Chlamydomonas_euryale.AAC.11
MPPLPNMQAHKRTCKRSQRHSFLLACAGASSSVERSMEVQPALRPPAACAAVHPPAQPGQQAASALCQPWGRAGAAGAAAGASMHACLGFRV